MTLSISELGRRFWTGETRGQSARTKIVDRGDYTYLVDYDWAVLGKRSKRTGLVSFYSGWYGYSPSTSRHIRRTNLENAEFMYPNRLKLSEVSYEEPKKKPTLVEKFRETYDDVVFDPFENRWKLKKRE